MTPSNSAARSRLYALECTEEFHRLERQASLKEYSFQEDLDDLPALTETSRAASFLDAGCGSGQGTHALSRIFPSQKIVGFDQSALRIEQARKAYPHDRIEFRVCDVLKEFPNSTDRYQGIFSRFVLQHIEQNQQLEFVRKLVNRLDAGGWLRVVDCDGLLINLSPFPEDLRESTQKIISEVGVDFLAGRKIPTFFQEAGLNQITCKVVPLVFFGENMRSEIEMMRERFRLSRPRLIETLGGAEAFETYVNSYLEAMAAPGSVVVYNKFIVTGVK